MQLNTKLTRKRLRRANRTRKITRGPARKLFASGWWWWWCDGDDRTTTSSPNYINKISTRARSFSLPRDTFISQAVQPASCSANEQLRGAKLTLCMRRIVGKIKIITVSRSCARQAACKHTEGGI